MRRALMLALLAVIGIALQTSVFSAVTLLGTRPQVVLLLVVAVAMAEGPGIGAVAGFTLGLVVDSIGGLVQGVGALTFTLAGYAVGVVRAHVSTPSAWLPMGVVAATSFLATAFFGTFSLVLGEETLTPLRVLRHGTLAAIYGALITPFCFPPVRALAARLRPFGMVEQR